MPDIWYGNGEKLAGPAAFIQVRSFGPMLFGKIVIEFYEAYQYS